MLAVSAGVVKLSPVASGVPPVEAAYQRREFPLVPAVPVSVAELPEQVELAGTVGLEGIGFTVTSTEDRALSQRVVEL